MLWSCLSVSRLALESNQISFVSFGFNCNYREEHQSLRLMTQITIRRRCSITVMSCMSEQLIVVYVDAVVDGEPIYSLNGILSVDDKLLRANRRSS